MKTSKPLGILNKNYEEWRKNVELREIYLRGQEPSSREEMIAEIRLAEREYNDEKLKCLMLTEKDKKLLSKNGLKR